MSNAIHIRPHNRKLTTALCGERTPKHFVVLNKDGTLPANLPSTQPCRECIEEYNKRRAAVEATRSEGEFRASEPAETEEEESSEPEARTEAPKGPHPAWGG